MKRTGIILLRSILFLQIVVSFIFFGCNKDNQTPEISTNSLSEIDQTSALCGGEITSEGAAKVTVRGVCWSNDHQPTIADDKTEDGEREGSFTSSISGLVPFTTYYVRAYATNRHGTGYGNTLTFKTLYGGEIVTDFDGNTYHTVTIGTQTWMVENLKVTHFRNGIAITNVIDSAQWDDGYYPEYCLYENNPDNILTYGLLYNQEAVLDTNGLAPIGWHVPNIDDFQTLIDYLGGVAIAGGKLKEYGTEHWTSPNLDASNYSGFTALPGGRRVYQGQFEGFGNIANFWTSYPWVMLQIEYDDPKALLFAYPANAGASVRCVKDQL